MSWDSIYLDWAQFWCSRRCLRNPLSRRAIRRFFRPSMFGRARTGTGITGASNSVITAEDIARSPGTTIQDVLSREAGVQTWSTTGGKNGATTTVDLRGFGATASSNTLFLLNGRRLNDIDLLGVDLSTIPRDSIERIEITRGNSGAVLYGDGAVGGVINIITKTGVAHCRRPRVSKPASARSISANSMVRPRYRSGPFAASVFANGVDSNGYRVNSALQQRNAIGDLRYTGSEGSAWFNIVGDEQHLGLPGARLVDSNCRDQRARDRSPRRYHADRLCRQERRGRHARRLAHCRPRRRTDCGRKPASKGPDRILDVVRF